MGESTRRKFDALMIVFTQNLFPGVSCSTVYAIPPGDGGTGLDNERVLEIPREQLKFVNKLGEGQFGEVRKMGGREKERKKQREREREKKTREREREKKKEREREIEKKGREREKKERERKKERENMI